MKYTNIPDSDAPYDWTVDLPKECEAYATAVMPNLRMRQMPGRDFIRNLMNELEMCHPMGLATPRALTSRARKSWMCGARPGQTDPGCVPRDSPAGHAVERRR